jgi:hypothetical protein
VASKGVATSLANGPRDTVHHNHQGDGCRTHNGQNATFAFLLVVGAFRGGRRRASSPRRARRGSRGRRRIVVVVVVMSCVTIRGAPPVNPVRVAAAHAMRVVVRPPPRRAVVTVMVITDKRCRDRVRPGATSGVTGRRPRTDAKMVRGHGGRDDGEDQEARDETVKRRPRAEGKVATAQQVRSHNHQGGSPDHVENHLEVVVTQGIRAQKGRLAGVASKHGIARSLRDPLNETVAVGGRAPAGPNQGESFASWTMANVACLDHGRRRVTCNVVNRRRGRRFRRRTRSTPLTTSHFFPLGGVCV